MLNPPYQRFGINFTTDDLNKFITHIASVSAIATAIFNATKEPLSESVTPLETDDLIIGFPDSKATSQTISEWVLSKAFEDFIIGLTQSLVEIYIMEKTALLAIAKRTDPFPTKEALDEALEKISKEAKKTNFPDLIEGIEKMLDVQLFLRDEIFSINKVRNCFVHHESKVKDPNGLTFKYIEKQYHIQIDGKVQRLTKELKAQGVHGERLYSKNAPVEFHFKQGEKIVITPNIFKDVTFTCIAFFQGLIRSSKLNDEAKNILAPSIVVDIQHKEKS